MEYNSRSNQASNFKSTERVARGRFEITSLITPELYDTKSYYQLIVPITKCENLSLGIFSNKTTGPVSFLHFSFPVEAGQLSWSQFFH